MYMKYTCWNEFESRFKRASLCTLFVNVPATCFIGDSKQSIIMLL